MTETSNPATGGQRTIVFRVRPWRLLDTYRDLELLERQILHDLHDAIQSAFELDDDHLYAFYLNNHAFDDTFDYPGPGLNDSERHASTTRLETLELKDNKRFLYLFDFGDELRHEVQVLRRGERSPDVPYPRQLGGEGSLPRQYPDWDLMDDPELAEDESAALESEADGGCVHTGVELSPEVRQALESMTAEVQRAVANFRRRAEGWLDADEDDEAVAQGEFDGPSHSDELRHEHGVAMQLLDAAKDDPMAIHVVVEHAIDDNVISWLRHLPDELSDAGLHAEAVELSERAWSSGSMPALRFPLFLARLGETERALASVEHSLAEFPDESEVLSVAGEVHETLGEDEAAITYYEQALQWVGSQRQLRYDIVAALLRLYERTGQALAGVRLLQQEQEREEARAQAMWSGWNLPSGPVVRARPKVGRNEPCPCGSGKKYKKCCGKAA